MEYQDTKTMIYWMLLFFPPWFDRHVVSFDATYSPVRHLTGGSGRATHIRCLCANNMAMIVDFYIHYFLNFFDRRKRKFGIEFEQGLYFLTSLNPCLCFRGTQILDLEVEGHRPLPFAFDILSAAF